jgi:hypothetical protein
MSKLPDSISITWHIDDVLLRAKETNVQCTHEKAREILQLMKANHDSAEGVSWGTIDYYLSTL